jgi:pimeloyl-ACP methyl ester carboxylesterase
MSMAAFAATELVLPPFKLDMPVLGLWSEHEAYLTEEGMKVSEAVVAPGKWRYERVEGAGHWMMRDAPDRVNQLLAEFLGSAERLS